MARAVTTSSKVGFTVVAWVVALLLFFPILWTILTASRPSRGDRQGFNLIPSLHARELRRGADAARLFQAASSTR